MFLRAALVLASLAVAVPALSAPMPVKAQKLVRHTKDLDLEFRYPKTGNAAIDADIARNVKALEIQTIPDPGDKEAGDPKWSGDLDYEVLRNDRKLFVIRFAYDIYSGGAHPNHELLTANYLMPAGNRVFLPEIIGDKGIAKVSRLAIADLNKQNDEIGFSSAEDIASGAGPAEENFRAFAWLPKTLHIDFNQYQVASYAAGPQEVDIPLSQLSGVIRTDWRAPQPSFDCAGARSPVEKTLCSDAALARLDRQMAEAFRQKKALVFEDVKQAALIREQRAWLKTRESACAAKTGPNTAACLTRLYGARIAALGRAP
ncbi:MAG: DUF1311 domain-containing protein [Alphaproteobacteria bacterium]|nr:DUF1311 domain-containing protein [Alphaproteobacteria bacterium]